MGLLDDLYRKGEGLLHEPTLPPEWDLPGYQPNWQSAPANDPAHPYVGLRRNQRSLLPPDMPLDAPYPDGYYSYPHLIPPGADDDRAYHPTLQYEDSMAGKREAELLRRRRLAIHENEPFQQPKTAEEIGLPPMTRGEKLRLLLNQYLGGDY